MLKISTIASSEQQITLRLDGQVTGAWGELLRNCSETLLEMGVQLTVDLTHVSFVDREGLVLVKRLMSRGVQLTNVPAFVAEQLRCGAP
jgi:ABC-type transporter Mla MlaB component